MSNFTSAAADAVVQTTPKRAWEIAGPIDATRFYPKFGPLPGVVEVRDQTGAWDAVGQTRTLLLSDGGSVVETITDADSPTFFAYELSDFHKIFGRLVSGARAEWRFERVEAGTSIRWSYEFFPLAGRGWIVGIIVRLFWAPYMKRVLPPIAAEVERVA
ncbi:MAG: SRPBCC family protein [Rhodoglobus sp.]|nr:SRPBCC family protein [Rhodoglobus sp.]